MDFERDGDVLTVHFRRDFNLLTARHLRQIAQGAREVRVDLSRTRLVDTEGLCALHALQSNDVQITLLDPPEMFYEVVDVLDLEDVFEVEVDAPDRGAGNV